MTKMISGEDFCALFGISERTLMKWIDQGMPHVFERNDARPDDNVDDAPASAPKRKSSSRTKQVSK